MSSWSHSFTFEKVLKGTQAFYNSRSPWDRIFPQRREWSRPTGGKRSTNPRVQNDACSLRYKGPEEGVQARVLNSIISVMRREGAVLSEGLHFKITWEVSFNCIVSKHLHATHTSESGDEVTRIKLAKFSGSEAQSWSR